MTEKVALRQYDNLFLVDNVYVYKLNKTLLSTSALKEIVLSQ